MAMAMPGGRVLRGLRVAWRCASLCLARDMQYRWHFWGNTFSGLLWTGMYLVFIQVIVAQVGDIAGWGRAELYTLYGTYMLMEAVAQTWIQPNMNQLSELVRTGGLDLILTKPLDPQFMLAVRQWECSGLGRGVAGLAVVALGMHAAGYSPGLAGYLAYLLALLAGAVILYTLWLGSVLIVFRIIRADAISVLFLPLFQMTRYPVGVYPRVLRALFQTVLPLVFVVTVPAQILMRPAGAGQVLLPLAVATLFLGLARASWLLALRQYSSASS